MNKYRKLSYFEVNRKIDELLYGVSSLKHPYNNDWCHDDSKSFHLLINSNMGLTFSHDIEKWIATGFSNNLRYRQAESESPCRAVAECFLLIKDAEKENG